MPSQPIKKERITTNSKLKRTNELQAAEAPRQKRTVKRRWDEDFKKDEDACQFLEVAAEGLTTNDDCTIFGQMVASQIRKLNQRNQAIAKNRIQNCIFELEMEEINATSAKKNHTLLQHSKDTK